MKRFKSVLYVHNLNQPGFEGFHIAQREAIANKAEFSVLIIVNAGQDILRDEENLKRSVKRAFLKEVDKVKPRFKFIFACNSIDIVQQAIKANHDLVVLRHENENRFQRFFYGSTPLTFMRKFPGVVWLVKPNEDQQLNRVMIAVDPSAPETDAVELNRKLIEIGISLSKRNKAECHVVHAWSLGYEGAINNPFLNINEQDLKPYKTKAKRKHSKLFNELVKDVKNNQKNTYFHLIEGDASNTLAQFVKDNDIDVIVMGVVQKTGVKGLLIGSTAEALLSQVHCSILAVKPGAFISPVL